MIFLKAGENQGKYEYRESLNVVKDCRDESITYEKVSEFADTVYRRKAYWMHEQWSFLKCDCLEESAVEIAYIGDIPLYIEGILP